MADVTGPYSLEGLDQFNNLDDLAFSLDSPVWASADTIIYDVSVSASANASANAAAQRILVGAASITATSSVLSDGNRLGDNWTDEQAGSNTWTDIPSGSNVWTQVPQGNNTWLRQG